MGDARSTTDVTHPDRGDGPARVRTRRIVYHVTSLVLAGLLAVTIADIRGDVLGVDTQTVTVAVPDGGALTVTHTSVTRPALASPFSVEVLRPGGFDGPIELAISRPWIESWDENGFYPSPDAETGDAEWVIYEFAPPDGDTFAMFYDARLEPGQQQDIEGTVELREAGTPVASVSFTTQVWP